jgi:hypothetical protein
LKFKIDENLPLEFAAILQGAGIEADTVADEDLSEPRHQEQLGDRNSCVFLTDQS